jgi:hypothetical protein
VLSALAIIVAVVNAAGPWSCCRVALLTGRPPATVPATKAEPVAPLCSHCRQEAKADLRYHPQSPPAPHKPADPCPCKERQLAAADAVLVSPSADPDRVTPAPDFVAASLLAEPTRWPTPAAGESVSELPFLTTRMRLRVHHALRC